MKRVDLHPEELLDRAGPDGSPRDGDRARLEAHVAVCAACAFERTVVRDFAEALEREEAGDAVAALTAAAGAMGDPRVRARVAGRAFPGVLARGRGLRFLVAAAVVLAAAVGAAAAAWYVLAAAERSDSAATSPAPVCPAGDAGHAVSAGPVPVKAPAPAPRGAVPATTVPAPPPPRPAPAVAPSAPAEHLRRAPVASRPDAGPAPGETAESLFTGANAARRVGDWGTAVASYDALGRRFPGSRQELLSRVTFGTLLLDVLGQPQRALGLFDGYLDAAPEGTMVEEALIGRASALERLGRAAEERAAWQQLLARFPDSPQSARARQRLEELP